MKVLLSAALVGWTSFVRAQCVEEELTHAPYCFTPTQAAYFCQNAGSTDLGWEQLVNCLDSSIRVRGRLYPDDRDSCLGGGIDEDGPVELASGCVSR